MFSYFSSSNRALPFNVDSQFTHFNDLNQTLARSFQAVCKADLKLGQTMITETLNIGQRMLSSKRAVDAIRAACARPAANGLRVYQQVLSRWAGEVQAGLIRMNQPDGLEKARSAEASADGGTRAATEESTRSIQKKQEVSKTFRDPFQPIDAQRGNGSARARSARHVERVRTAARASMRFDGLADNGAVQGHVQGPLVQAAGNKPLLEAS
jgi:hypothetical protein